MLSLITVLLYFTQQSSFASPQKDHWEPTNGPYSTIIYSMAANKAGHIFAGVTYYEYTDGLGVYRSTDNGETWEWKNNGLGYRAVFTLTVDSADYIFAGTPRDGIFRSKDNAETWEQVIPTDWPNPATYLWVSDLTVDTGSAVLATTSKGLLRSSDHGDNWDTVLSGSGGIIKIDRDNRIFLARDRLQRSTNQGVTWVTVDDGLPRGGFWALAITQTGDLFVSINNQIAGLYRSTDHGATWIRVLDENIESERLSVLSIGTDAFGNIFIGTTKGIYRSTNNGETWTSANEGIKIFNVAKVFVTTPTYTFTGTKFWGVFKTNDHGDLWRETNNGFPKSSVFGLVERPRFLFEDSCTFLVAVGSHTAGIVKSTDCGKRWLRGNFNLFPFDTQPLSVAVSKYNSLLISGWLNAGVRYSFDAIQWYTSPNVMTSNIWSVAIHETSSTYQVLLAGGFSRIARKTWNNPESWSVVLTTTTQVMVINTQLATHIFAGTLGEGVYCSSDHGLTWEQKNTGLTNTNVWSISIDDSGYVFAGTSDGIYQSTNNGANWTRVGLDLGPMPPTRALAQHPYTDAIFAAIGQSVHQSNDHGISWTQVGDNLPNDITSLLVDSYGRLLAGIIGNLGNINSPGYGIYQFITSPTAVEEKGGGIPTSFVLHQNYPNPWNPTTTIELEIPTLTAVDLKVYNTLGQLMMTAANGTYNVGHYQVTVDGSKWPSGIYFYVLHTDNALIDRKKMILIK
ncbi:T9SS type A sorting domain-containing protein [Candidatus Jorgensenbacteria bacterium]|nr:T9SS type A sorting domain-containing protein [Candidatus Jorgensenbacteria bacterium]